MVMNGFSGYTLLYMFARGGQTTAICGCPPYQYLAIRASGLASASSLPSAPASHPRASVTPAVSRS